MKNKTTAQTKKRLMSIGRYLLIMSTAQAVYIMIMKYILKYNLEFSWLYVFLTFLLAVGYSYLDSYFDKKVKRIDDRSMMRIDYALGTEWKLDYFNQSVGRYRKIGIHLLPLQVFITFYRR